MKHKLAVFFAGFGAGIVVTFIGLALALDVAPAPRHVSRPTIVYSDTNAAAQWQRVNVAYPVER